MKYQYEDDPWNDPNRDSDWMWRGTLNSPTQRMAWDVEVKKHMQELEDKRRAAAGLPPSRFGGGGAAGPGAAGSAGASGGAGGAGGAGAGATGGPTAGAAGAKVGGLMSQIAPALIQSGGQLGGAAIGGKGAEKAAKIQAGTADKALAFAREQEAERRRNYNEAISDYRTKMGEWQQLRESLLALYGVPTNVAGLSGSGDISAGAPGGNSSAPARAPGSYAPGSASTLGRLAALYPGERAQGSPSMDRRPTWNDWTQMGLGQG